MRVLLSNDDGVDAPGLGALFARLTRNDEVWVVAPLSEQSAQSHSLTMHRPLRVVRHGERRFAVTGTPADCIYLGLHHLLKENPPDLVVSGINYGSNLGTDVHYSGTVAAAREACLQGVPAIAVSLERCEDGRAMQWGTACAVAERVVKAVRERPLPPRVFLNVNVPNLPLPELRGLKACRLSDRYYQPFVEERVDPRGRAYLWIGGRHSHYGDDPESDGPAADAGWATVSPVMATSTISDLVTSLRDWTDA